MVWRYHPRTKAFEIFAEGGGNNTNGLEVDSLGRLHSGHNGSGTRGFHFVQGGFYQMQGVDPASSARPRNPYAFGELPQMSTSDKTVRFTHFGAFADGTAMPSNYAGLLFALDPLHNTVLTSVRKPRGATFETKDQEPALRSSDTMFRPGLHRQRSRRLALHRRHVRVLHRARPALSEPDRSDDGRIYRLRGKDASWRRTSTSRRSRRRS
jgi:hypothetical protein